MRKHTTAGVLRRRKREQPSLRGQRPPPVGAVTRVQRNALPVWGARRERRLLTHCWGHRHSKATRSFSHLEASSPCLSKHCQNSSRAPQHAFLSSIVGADIFTADLRANGGLSARPALPRGRLRAPAAPRRFHSGARGRPARGPKAPGKRRAGREGKAPGPAPDSPARLGLARRRSRLRKRHGAPPRCACAPRRRRMSLAGGPVVPPPRAGPPSPWGRSCRFPRGPGRGSPDPPVRSRSPRGPFRGACPRCRRSAGGGRAVGLREARAFNAREMPGVAGSWRTL